MSNLSTLKQPLNPKGHRPVCSETNPKTLKVSNRLPHVQPARKQTPKTLKVGDGLPQCPARVSGNNPKKP
jgi:hypothetical protein